MTSKLSTAPWLVLLLLALAACVGEPPAAPTPALVPPPTNSPQPTLTESPAPTAVPSNTPAPTQTVAPTQTLAPTATATVPTNTPTTTRTATSTTTNTPRPTITPTVTPIPPPTEIPGPAQVCANMAASGRRDIRILYINPQPELAWDNTPRFFHVGVCDTIPAPNTPQGKYQISMTFPGGNRGEVHSNQSSATLYFGLNDVAVGPWIPGLENHMAICVTRAVGETRVMYSDNPDNIFHPLLWDNGADTVGLPIKCGGDYS